MNTKAEFTLKVVKHLLDNKFSVLLHNKDQIDGYGGWLETEEGSKELSVAMSHHMGFEILLHEYCHFLQYKNNRKFWDESAQYYDILFDWAGDKDLLVDDATLDKSLKTILAIEHDCEKRALKLVSLNPIQDFDVTKYKKAANSYLWSYHLMRELRQRPKKPIYTEIILENAPSNFEPDLEFYLDTNNLGSEFKSTLLTGFDHLPQSEKTVHQ